MTTSSEVPLLVQEKLAAFEQLQPEFETCFQFVQDLHGQRNFAQLTVADIVYYLHARWICECKGQLLSVARTVKEYEGRRCLELLRSWQEQGDTAAVVAFLTEKLDMLPLADITRQIQQAKDARLAGRLQNGRKVLLQRGFHLMRALDALFTLSDEELQQQVESACEQYQHQPAQIAQQLAEQDSPLYSFHPHQLLAQRNMQVMNSMGMAVAQRPSDLPGERTWRVVEPTEPLSPYAEQVVAGYQELLAPQHNNVLKERFTDQPEQSEEGGVV